MKTRVISAVVGIILLLAILYVGGHVLSISALALTLISQKEFADAYKLPQIKLSYLMTICFYVIFVYFNLADYQLLFFLGSSFVFLSHSIFLSIPISKSFLGFSAFFYTAVPIYALLKLYETPFLIYTFLIAFGTDSGAYIFGKLFGKHKLIPSVSPNKTIEGAIGGIFTAVVLSGGFAFFQNKEIILQIVIMTFFASILSQFGDLIASKIKRETGIKDFGKIMPGHGGVLDRFDSILIAAPFIYLFGILIARGTL